MIIKVSFDYQATQTAHKIATANKAQTLTAEPTFTSTMTPTATSTLTLIPAFTPTRLLLTSTPTSFATKSLSDHSGTPEQFVRNYFSNINNRQYEMSWSMLSKKFQATHTYDEYTSWWNTVNKVEIILIEVKSQNDIDVYIYVEAHYYYKNGVVTTGHTTYKLVKNESGESWLFDPN